MADLVDNTAETLAALAQAKARALEIIGQKIESYAKALCPVKTGTLRGSITHKPQQDSMIVGSAVNYAPYVELGTGKAYNPPPSWMENNAPRGAGIIAGRKPKPYLRPAVENHISEYQNIMQNELRKA